jgi:isopentenyl diphosphate isomerase/L-lactate dehydrogenase-like FMN-dependent dehydrogenase
MIDRCLAANFDVLALTVDTITGGNRERDLRTGFTSPPRCVFAFDGQNFPVLQSSDSPIGWSSRHPPCR